MKEKVNITNEFRSLIIKGLRDKGMKHVDLGNKLKKSKSWTTKLLQGSLKSLSADDWETLVDMFDIGCTITETDPFPTSFHTLKDLCQNDPHRLNLVDGLVDLLAAQKPHLPYIPTDKLIDFGEEITRAAHEDPDKPGKVGRIGIVWLARYIESVNDKK